MAEADEALFPEICVVCHACNDELPVPPGLTAIEAAWMHEPECRALIEAAAAVAS
jgi:hypothetical protein